MLQCSSTDWLGANGIPGGSLSTNPGVLPGRQRGSGDWSQWILARSVLGPAMASWWTWLPRGAVEWACVNGEQEPPMRTEQYRVVSGRSQDATHPAVS